MSKYLQMPLITPLAWLVSGAIAFVLALGAFIAMPVPSDIRSGIIALLMGIPMASIWSAWKTHRENKRILQLGGDWETTPRWYWNWNKLGTDGTSAIARLLLSLLMIVYTAGFAALIAMAAYAGTSADQELLYAVAGVGVITCIWVLWRIFLPVVRDLVCTLRGSD